MKELTKNGTKRKKSEWFRDLKKQFNNKQRIGRAFGVGTHSVISTHATVQPTDIYSNRKKSEKRI